MAKQVKQRDKERTKQKLIAAVGKVLKKEGYTGVRINKVAQVAGVSKKLIYDYFKDFDGLTKAYLEQVDFWHMKELRNESIEIKQLTRDIIFNVLKSDFEYFQNSIDMQKIVLWGISEKNKTIRDLTDGREVYGNKLLKLSDKMFEKSSVDFRAVSAILVAAIYYIVLHAKTNGSTMCGIDASTDEGKERILNAVGQILDWSYKSVPPK